MDSKREDPHRIRILEVSARNYCPCHGITCASKYPYPSANKANPPKTTEKLISFTCTDCVVRSSRGALEGKSHTKSHASIITRNGWIFAVMDTRERRPWV